MKKILLLLFLSIFLISCSIENKNFEKRLSILESSKNENSSKIAELEGLGHNNQSRIDILYNRDEYNPVVIEKNINLMKMSTVVVTSQINGDPYSTSGFAIKSEETVEGIERDMAYVWTVSHAVTNNKIKKDENNEIENSFSKAKHAIVIFKSGNSLDCIRKAEILAYDLSLDIALLKVDITGKDIDIPDIEFSTIQRRIGANIVAVGHPGPRRWAITEGLVSSYDLKYTYFNEEGEVKFGKKIMETTMDVSFGYSGSPVFDPMTGKIYGYTSKMTSDTKDALVIPIEYLVKFAVNNNFQNALPE